MMLLRCDVMKSEFIIEKWLTCVISTRLSHSFFMTFFYHASQNYNFLYFIMYSDLISDQFFFLSVERYKIYLIEKVVPAERNDKRWHKTHLCQRIYLLNINRIDDDLNTLNFYCFQSTTKKKGMRSKKSFFIINNKKLQDVVMKQEDIQTFSEIERKLIESKRAYKGHSLLNVIMTKGIYL